MKRIAAEVKHELQRFGPQAGLGRLVEAQESYQRIVREGRLVGVNLERLVDRVCSDCRADR